MTRILLDRVLRERIAAAGVLADDAAVQDVVLVAGAVDEDVRVEAGNRRAEDLLVVIVVRCRDSGREHREVQKVAVVLRQDRELLPRDVGRDLALHGVDQRGRAGHGDLLRSAGREHEVEGLDLAQDDARLSSYPCRMVPARLDRVVAGWDLQVEEAVGAAHGRAGHAGSVIGGFDRDARQAGRAFVTDVASEGSGRRLGSRGSAVSAMSSQRKARNVRIDRLVRCVIRPSSFRSIP